MFGLLCAAWHTLCWSPSVLGHKQRRHKRRSASSTTGIGFHLNIESISVVPSIATPIVPFWHPWPINPVCNLKCKWHQVECIAGKSLSVLSTGIVSAIPTIVRLGHSLCACRWLPPALHSCHYRLINSKMNFQAPLQPFIFKLLS